MANGVPSRLYKFAYGQDVAINGALGGREGETCSGSVGRALDAEERWAPAAQRFVDGIFGKGHCRRVARREALVRAVVDQFSE